MIGVPSCTISSKSSRTTSVFECVQLHVIVKNENPMTQLHSRFNRVGVYEFGRRQMLGTKLYTFAVIS